MAYNNIYYRPTGNRLQIMQKEGYKIIVDDIYGNEREPSYSLNWNLIYSIENGLCYYHIISEDNEIDIDSLAVEEDGQLKILLDFKIYKFLLFRLKK